jgi:hypothetical protein
MEPDDEERKCYRCGELKPVDEFAWRRKARGQRDSFCRPCRSAYGKEHYAANRQRYIDQARIVRQRLALERTRYLLDYFVVHPCVDCGERDPVVLEFDHLRDKRFAISSQLHGRNWQTILDEIEKCECGLRKLSSTPYRPPSRRTARDPLWTPRPGRDRIRGAGDGNRTRASTLEGSHAAFTPRPRAGRMIVVQAHRTRAVHCAYGP